MRLVKLLLLSFAVMVTETDSMASHLMRTFGNVPRHSRLLMIDAGAIKSERVNNPKLLKNLYNLMIDKGATEAERATAKTKFFALGGNIEEFGRKNITSDVFKTPYDQSYSYQRTSVPNFIKFLDNWFFILKMGWKMRHMFFGRTAIGPTLRAADVIVPAGGAIGAGAYLYNKKTEDTPIQAIETHETPQQVEQAKLIEQVLQEITQETAKNNQKIALLQHTLATDNLRLKTNEQDTLRNEISYLEFKNMLLIEKADKVMGGHGQEDVQIARQMFEQNAASKFRQPISIYQRSKNWLHDNVGVYINRYLS